jgi:hypothetical protein
MLPPLGGRSKHCASADARHRRGDDTSRNSDFNGDTLMSESALSCCCCWRSPSACCSESAPRRDPSSFGSCLMGISEMEGCGWSDIACCCAELDGGLELLGDVGEPSGELAVPLVCWHRSAGDGEKLGPELLKLDPPRKQDKYFCCNFLLGIYIVHS